MANVSLSGVVFSFLLLALQGTSSMKRDVTTGGLIFEVLAVVDHSAYTQWYNWTDHSWPAAKRETATKDTLQEAIATMVHSTNNIYKTLEAKNIFIKMKLVGVVFKQSVRDSAFFETNKNGTLNGTVVVNRDKAIQDFVPVSQQLQASIPHDHAMALTQYRLSYATNGTNVVGYAYQGVACQLKSVSLIRLEGFDSVTTIAHELGHSLDCNHDGDENSCGHGFLMDPVKPHNKTGWVFSDCSADYIRKYIQRIQTQHQNCLDLINDNHVDPVIEREFGEWYGEVFSHDRQCQLKYGPESYLCRSLYKTTYNRTNCDKLMCKLPGDTDDCSSALAGDATPCGQDKYCMADECVSSPYKNNVTDDCFAGEHTGKVANKTCDEIGRHYRGLCEDSGVKRQCCKACVNYGTLVTSMTDIDAQCKVKHGAGSSFCRGATTYDNIAFGEIVCSKMYCTDLDNPKMCSGFIADDKTACGNKKWCINGSCVHNDLAPAVPDDCPWSQDDPTFRLTTGETCDDVALPANHYLCNTEAVAKRCCNTCHKYKQNIPGCEYGDQNPSSCAPYFPSKPYMCYTSPNDQICCGSCAKHRNSSNVGCEYGDHSVASCASYFPSRRDICYTASNLVTCCASCAKYRNVNLAGCEYGDKLSGCQQSLCSRYDATNRQGCCETCHSSPEIVG